MLRNKLVSAPLFDDESRAMANDPFLRGAQAVRDAREVEQKKVADIRRHLDGEKARLERILPIVSSRFINRGYRIEVLGGVVKECLKNLPLSA